MGKKCEKEGRNRSIQHLKAQETGKNGEHFP
jgi:hypothetical protein